MLFKYNYVLRKQGKMPMFMTNYSNAMGIMMEKTGLNESTCQMLLHVYAFSYFKKDGVTKTSQLKGVDQKISDLKISGYIREVAKGVEGFSTAVYCISPDGEAACIQFYNNLI